jgi:hypothetical protein
VKGLLLSMMAGVAAGPSSRLPGLGVHPRPVYECCRCQARSSARYCPCCGHRLEPPAGKSNCCKVVEDPDGR